MTITKYLNPRNDIAFKRIFGEERNKNILIHFLNDIITQDRRPSIEEISVENSARNPETAFHKQVAFDVLCTDTSGIQYIVEMQVAKVSGFEKRTQYYTAKTYVNQMKAGGEYENLKEVIFLAIVDFVMFPDRSGYKSDHVILDEETHDHD